MTICVTADDCRQAGAADAAADPEPGPELAARLAGLIAPFIAREGPLQQERPARRRRPSLLHQIPPALATKPGSTRSV